MRQILQVFSCDVVSKVGLAAAGLLLIRWMLAGDFAQYIFVMAVANVATQTTCAVVNRVYLLAASPTDRKHACALFVIQICLCVLIATIVVIVVDWKFSRCWVVLPVAVSICTSEFAKTIYQRQLAFGRFSIVELARTVLFLGGITITACFFPKHLDYVSVLAMQSASQLLSGSIALRTALDLKALADFNAIRDAWQSLANGACRYLTAYFVVLATLSNLPVLVLRTVAVDVEQAAFGSAFRYAALLQLALGAVHTVMLPTLQHASSVHEISAILRRQQRFVPLFAAVVVGIAAFSSLLLPWVDRGQYPSAVPIFQILCVSTIIGFACSPFVNVLFKLNDFAFCCWIVFAGFAITVAALFALVSRMGGVGAAWGTTLGFSFINLAIMLRSRSLLREVKCPVDTSSYRRAA